MNWLAMGQLPKELGQFRIVVRIMDSIASHFAAVEVVAGNHFAALAAGAGR